MENYEWWDHLDSGKRHVLLLAALVPPPVSLDTLIAVSRFKAVEILQFLRQSGKLTCCPAMRPGTGILSFYE